MRRITKLRAEISPTMRCAFFPFQRAPANLLWLGLAMTCLWGAPTIEAQDNDDQVETVVQPNGSSDVRPTPNTAPLAPSNMDAVGEDQEEEDADEDAADGNGDDSGAVEIVQSGSAAAASDSANSDSDESDDEEEAEDLTSSQGVDFLLPVDGDVFHTAEVNVLINVQGLEPTGLVMVLDGYNYDQPLQLETGLIRTRIAALHNGVHDLKMLLLDNNNQIIGKSNVRFFVRVPEPKKVNQTGPVRQFGRIAARMDVKGAEARSRIRSQSELKLENGEVVAGKKEKPLGQQLDGAMEGSYNLKVYNWEAHGKVLLRTDEDPYRQPAHRLSARIQYGPYAYIKAGDVYPAFNDLMLSGARLRGGEAGLALFANDISWATLKVARGESRREIPSYIAVYDTGNGTRTDTLSGTFAQNITALRLGFGGGSHFDLGFSAMMAEDKVGSDEKLALVDTLRGIRPMQNAVSGMDLRIGLWEGRIQIFSNLALSLLTRDKSLGATNGDEIDLEVNPQDYEDFFIINPTTVGAEYLIQNTSSESDIMGFVMANSAMDFGISASIPLSGLVTESEIRFDHLGLLYHTEGNPFLGSDPGDGLRFLQKVLLLENRLSLGVEASAFSQDLGLSQQQERGYKAEIRWTPVVTETSGWISIGSTERAPDGEYPYQYKSSFQTVNSGAYQQFIFPFGRIHASALYGFTHSDFQLTATQLVDSTIADLLRFPATNTHIANVSLQMRPRAIDFLPRLAYTFSSNGIQLPTHSVNMGFQQLLLDGRVKGDFGVQIGQYPITIDENDLTVGETFSLELRFTPTQTARFTEKWIEYGDRRNVSVGGFYELYF
jgi:hypothetical protein